MQSSWRRRFCGRKAYKIKEISVMIKIAVISDIHGNYKALEAFLKYIEEHTVDGIICLGD